MYKVLGLLGVLGIVSILGAYVSLVVLASDVSTATNVVEVSILNSTGADIDDAVISVGVSTQSLVDAGLLSSSAFNSAIHEGATDIPYMPGTLKVAVESAYNNAAVSETTAANNSTSDDVTLPAGSGEVYEVAFHNPGTILYVDTSTVTDAVWTITWEYYDGSGWSSFSNVSDGTEEFSVVGIRKITWDRPTGWVESTLHSIDAYWARARVSAFTSLTVEPLGRQVWYETGQWWTFVNSLVDGFQTSYDVYVGGSTGIQTYHYYFPGDAGIVVADDPALELGNQWDIDISGYFDTSAPEVGETKDIVHKNNAFRVYVSSAGTITITITGSGVSDFFSSSTDAEVGNLDTTYERARSELIGESVTTGATGSRVGQSYNTVQSASQSIGAKVDDPS